jgi:hypothetical protein
MKRISKKNNNKGANKKKCQTKKEKRKILRAKHRKKTADEKNNIDVEASNANKNEDIRKKKNLIRTIFNLREAKRQLSFLGIDIKNISSKLNDELFKSCCEILSKIDRIINSKHINHKGKKDKYFHLSKEYYKLIPHTFPFPDYNMYLINDISKIQRELCLLELIKSYSQLETVFQTIKYNKEENDLNNSVNLNDSINLSVNNIENTTEEEHHVNISNPFFEKALTEFDFSINLISHSDKKYKEINTFLEIFSIKDKGPFPPLVLIDLFELSREDDKNNEVNLLWYGCEIPHFYSILKNGFRLPFKEAPKNAYIYGKGIQFSDNPYKQLQKCLPKNNIAYLFICSTDNLNLKFIHSHHKDYPEKLDKKFDTVSIRNKIKMSFEDSDEESNDKPPYVNYYDIIIYDPSLVKVSYIAKVQIP